MLNHLCLFYKVSGQVLIRKLKIAPIHITISPTFDNLVTIEVKKSDRVHYLLVRNLLLAIVTLIDIE